MSFKANGGKGPARKRSEIDIGDKSLSGQQMSQVLGKICGLLCTNILNAIVTVLLLPHFFNYPPWNDASTCYASVRQFWA